MAEREWKPGAVAMRVGPNGSEKIAICVTGCGHHGDESAHWHTVTKSGRPDWDTLAYDGVTYHPLVVIDPTRIPHLGEFADDDPRGALKIIADDLRDVGAGDLDAAEAIVRWLAEKIPTPPKPAEPTGLGAVVEDADGRHFVRQVDGWWRGDEPCSLNYAAIDAVRVLSEGVTP